MMGFSVKAVRLGITAVLILSSAVACKFCSTAVIGVFEKITLISVQGYLPVKVGESEHTEEAKVKVQEKKEDEEIKEEKTEIVKSASAKLKSNLTKVDSDITKLMKTAEKNSSKDKKDGEIYEYTFKNDGVTDSFENVRVKNTNKTQLDIEKKLNEKLKLSVNKKEPAVLIYHTHTTETYQLLDRDFYAQGFLSRSDDENVNMVRVGKAVAEEIEKLGYKVIHDTTIYDKTYSGAYYRSEDAARDILKKYPSIKITLDIHRDAIQNDKGTKTKPTAVIDGKKAAQIMLITGCQEEGNGITDLPEWEKNLTFALKLQQSMETMFEGLTRPVYFCARSYNMSLTPCSLLVEMGTDANTLDEAVYSGKMLGRALGKILGEYEEN